MGTGSQAWIVMSALVCLMSSAHADWPMAGHDVRRSSCASEDPTPAVTGRLWTRKIVPFIASKTQIITVRGDPAAGRPDLIFVAHAEGVNALNPATGEDVWVYKTTRPVTNSPTFSGGVLYIACWDRTIHAVDAATGKKLWQSDRAGGGYDVNPLVVNGKLYAGCRDGFFYCFDAATGKYLWSYQTEGPIAYSAAYAAGEPDRVFFAGLDCRAYALDAQTGKLLWKSDVLPGEGFYSWWPVVHQDKVMFAGSNNYGVESGRKLVNQVQGDPKTGAWGPNPSKGQLPGPKDADGRLNMQRFVDWFRNEKREAQTFFVLDQADGKESLVAPLLYSGNPSGGRCPPAVAADGTVWMYGPLGWNAQFTTAGVIGWQFGSSPAKAVGYIFDSSDEPHVLAIVGEGVTWGHKQDEGVGTIDFAGKSLGSFKNNTWGEDYHSGYKRFNYGDYYIQGDKDKTSAGKNGSHGNTQNPPLPLNGRLYFHRANAVICLAPLETSPPRAGRTGR